MASTPARQAILLACTVLLTPIATAQIAAAKKPALEKSYGVQAAVATVPSAPGGGFLGGSDDCSTPTPLLGDLTISFDLTSATTGTEGQNETICYFFGSSTVDNDVWYEWTPGLTGSAAIKTCNTTPTDTKIAAYPGGGCPANGTAIACNDDACNTLQTAIAFPATAGASYTIQLGTFPGASGGPGDIVFATAPTPPTPPDDCASPEVLPGAGTYAFDLQTATTGTEGQNEANCTSSGATAIEDDAWYTYTATCDGMATVTTCGLTSVDTRIAVYPGAGCPADGSSITCNDDDCGLQSSVTWPVTIGSTYTIQLGVFPGSNTNNTPGLFQLLDPCAAPDYPASCFGDTGSCGCGNTGASGEGCVNSTGVGAVLAASGFASLNSDSLVLSATQTTNQPGIFFQANNALNPAPTFGDGYRCCGMNVVRIGTYFPAGGTTDTATGNLIGGQGPPIATHPGNSGLMGGDMRCYQWWYRDPTGPCGGSFNLSNAVSVTWAP